MPFLTSGTNTKTTQPKDSTTAPSLTPAPADYKRDKYGRIIATSENLDQILKGIKIGDNDVVEGFNFDGLDLSNQVLENLHFKNCSFLGAKMPNLKKIIFYDGCNLSGANFSSKKLEDVFFGYPYIDGMMIKSDPNPTLVGANFSKAIFSQDDNHVLDNPQTIWRTSLNGATIRCASEPRIRGEELDLNGAKIEFKDGIQGYTVKNALSATKVEQEHGLKTRATIGNAFRFYQGKVVVGISSDCNVEEAKKDLSQSDSNATEISALDPQVTKRFVDSIQEQFKPIANHLEIVNSDRVQREVDYKVNLCSHYDPKKYIPGAQAEYLERQIPSQDQSHQSQIIIGRDYQDLDPENSASMHVFNHEIGHIAPHRFSHQQEGGYTNQDSLLLMTYNNRMSTMGCLSATQTAPQQFRDSSADFSRSEMEAFGPIYGSKPQFEDREVEYFPGKDVSGKSRYEKYLTQAACRNTIVGEGKTGILNVDLSKILEGHKIGVFDVSRSFGECDNFPCSPENLVKGYEKSVMVLEYDSQGKVVKFHNMEGSQGSNIKIMIRDVKGEVFNYFDKFKPIRLIDEKPDEFANRVFDKNYSFTKQSTSISRGQITSPKTPIFSTPQIQGSSSPARIDQTSPAISEGGPAQFSQQTSNARSTLITTPTPLNIQTSQDRATVISDEELSSIPATTYSAESKAQTNQGYLASQFPTTSQFPKTSPMPTISSTPIPAITTDGQSQGLSSGVIAGIAGAGAGVLAALVGFKAYKALQKRRNEDRAKSQVNQTGLEEGPSAARPSKSPRPSGSTRPSESPVQVNQLDQMDYQMI